jgi:ribosomal protein L22
MNQAPSDAVSASLRQRTWLWYDSDDERKEQAKERKGLTERYAKAGYAKRLNVAQSQKKMDRVLKLVRGLRYDEAIHQLRMIPHKAGRIVIECLEKAHEDAVSKGLDVRRLVVATLFGTKGQNETTGMIYMGKGFSAPKILHRTHITVALREAYTEEERISRNKNNRRARSQRHREMSFEEEAMEASVVGSIGRGRKAPKGLAFGARIVPPLMHPVPSPLPRFTPPASKEVAVSTRGEEASSIDPLSLIPTSLKEDDKDQTSPPLSPLPPPQDREIKSQPIKASRPSIKKKFDYRREV